MAAETLPIQDEIQEERVTEESTQAIDREIDSLLANATLQDRPEALRQVTEGSSTTDEPAQIGRELEQSTEPITEELYRNSEETSEGCENSVFQAILELVDTVFPQTEGEEKPVNAVTNTQQLDRAFEDAIESLINVPFADQTYPERLITFLKCTTFAIRLVNRYKQSRKNESNSRVVWVVHNVGRLLIRAAIRYKLGEFIRNIGGWQGMYNTVCSYIRGLQQTDASGSSRSILPKYTYPVAIVLVGGALLAGYIYFRK